MTDQNTTLNFLKKITNNHLNIKSTVNLPKHTRKFMWTSITEHRSKVAKSTNFANFNVTKHQMIHHYLLILGIKIYKCPTINTFKSTQSQCWVGFDIWELWDSIITGTGWYTCVPTACTMPSWDTPQLKLYLCTLKLHFCDISLTELSFFDYYLLMHRPKL